MEKRERMNAMKCWISKVLWLVVVGMPLATTSLVAAEAEAETATKTASAAGRQVWLTFGLDHVPGLGAEVMGNPAWQYLAFLIYVVLAFYVSKLLDYLIQEQLRKWAAKTETKLDDLLLDLLRGPVKVIAFVTLLHIGLRLFNWPEWTSKFISNGLTIIVACSLTYIAVKFVDLAVGLWKQKTEAGAGGVGGSPALSDHPEEPEDLRGGGGGAGDFAEPGDECNGPAGVLVHRRPGSWSGGAGYAVQPVRSGGHLRGQAVSGGGPHSTRQRGRHG